MEHRRLRFGDKGTSTFKDVYGGPVSFRYYLMRIFHQMPEDVKSLYINWTHVFSTAELNVSVYQSPLKLSSEKYLLPG